MVVFKTYTEIKWTVLSDIRLRVAVVSVAARHARDPGSIPGRDDNNF